MKRIISLVLIFALLLTSCVKDNKVSDVEKDNTEIVNNVVEENRLIYNPDEMQFTGLNDEKLHEYMKAQIYSQLIDEIDSDKYFIENIDIKYISKEYLEEVEYNSQENIYFGYTLSEIEELFDGGKYIFTLGEDGNTVVKEFEKYDDIYAKMIRNIAIGSGIIVICVTVSAATGGSAPAISAIFMASAKSATSFSLFSGLFSGVSDGIITGIETNDFEKAIKTGAVSATEGFKWGAISGTVLGGAGKFFQLKGATAGGLKLNEVAKIQKESKYPVDVIKALNNMDQYKLLQKGKLKVAVVDGKISLVRKINLKYKDNFGRTNLERMSLGYAPLDENGIAYELHHIGQKKNSTLAILTQEEHRLNGNSKIWHKLGVEGEVHVPGGNWDTQRKNYWKSFANLIENGGI